MEYILDIGIKLFCAQRLDSLIHKYNCAACQHKHSQLGYQLTANLAEAVTVLNKQPVSPAAFFLLLNGSFERFFGIL